MSGFDFSANWNRMHRAVGEAAVKGKLPGKWGLLQDLVGHWAIPKRDRGLIRYGKAAIDSVGAIYSYRKDQETESEEGKSPTHAWLNDHGFERAVAFSEVSVEDFIRKALGHLEFSKKTVKLEKRTGEVYTHKVRDGFQICFVPFDRGHDSSGYGGDGSKDKGIPLLWEGPYIKPEHKDDFYDFVKDQVWNLVGGDGIVLTNSVLGYSEKVSLRPLAASFDFVGGKEAQNDLNALVTRCEAFLSHGMDRKILLHGPPGTGKTTLARAVAQKSQGRVVQLERNAVERMATSASVILKILNPNVVIVNDIDRSSSDAHHELLEALETDKNGGLRGVLIFVTVNDITTLDPALLRPGRIDEIREVAEPNKETRQLILRYYEHKFGVALTPTDTEKFLEESEGFSPADIRGFTEVAKAVGVELALSEIDRIKKQRELYAGDKCQEFNSRRGR